MTPHQRSFGARLNGTRQARSEMNHKFQASIQRKDEVAYLKLSGVIDEDNELFDLLDQLGGGTVVIDLCDIERINSCGVRDWVNWLTQLGRKGTDVILVECSPAVVAHINLVDGFIAESAIHSFYAPYFCPICEIEKVLLLELDEMKAMEAPTPPSCRCDECHGVMEFDEDDAYFAFVPKARTCEIGEEVEKAMAELTGSDPTGGRKIRTRRGSSTFAGRGDEGGSEADPAGSATSADPLSSLPDLATVERGGEEASREYATSGSSGAGRNRRADLALVLVVILLLAAAGLLAYVILTGGLSGDREADAKAARTSSRLEHSNPAPRRKRSTGVRRLAT